MVEIVSITDIKDCLDGLITREYFLDKPLTEALMQRLAREASLQYFPHFPKPLFIIKKKRFYQIKGIVGNDYFRVNFYRSCQGNHDELIASNLGCKLKGRSYD